MLFEELVEQHRVHGVVANGIDFTVLIAHHKVRIHFRYFFGDQTKLRRVGRIALVVKRHRFKCQDGLAGLVNRFNPLLKAPRRTGRTKLTVGVY